MKRTLPSRMPSPGWRRSFTEWKQVTSPWNPWSKNYQSGVSLLKLCRAKIEAAEMKVKEVSGGDAVELQPEG